MKRWIAAAVGLFGLVAYVRRRRSRSAPPEVEPADELRAKLAQQREEPPPAASEPEPAAPFEPEPAAAPEPESAAPSEPEPAPEPEPVPDAVAEKRRDVHDRARAVLDELG